MDRPGSPAGGGDETEIETGDALEAAVRERGREDARRQLDHYEAGSRREHAAAHMLLTVMDALLPMRSARVLSAYYEGYVEVVEDMLGPRPTVGPVPPRPRRGDEEREGDG